MDSSLAKLERLSTIDEGKRTRYLLELQRRGETLPTNLWPICYGHSSKSVVHLCIHKPKNGKPENDHMRMAGAACGATLDQMKGRSFTFEMIHGKHVEDRTMIYRGRKLCKRCWNTRHYYFLIGYRVHHIRSRPFRPTTWWQQLYGAVTQYHGGKGFWRTWWRRDELWIDTHELNPLKKDS